MSGLGYYIGTRYYIVPLSTRLDEFEGGKASIKNLNLFLDTNACFMAGAHA